MGSIMQPRDLASSFVVPQVSVSMVFVLVTWMDLVIIYPPAITTTPAMRKLERNIFHRVDLACGGMEEHVGLSRSSGICWYEGDFELVLSQNDLTSLAIMDKLLLMEECTSSRYGRMERDNPLIEELVWRRVVMGFLNI